jgi:hypothetical protein
MFVDEALDIPAGQLDGALVWDTLDFLAGPLLEATVQRLLEALRPGGTLLAYFSARAPGGTSTVYSFRIADERTVQLVPRAHRTAIQSFNNRSIERMFGSCRSVKFFLTRENLREVIARR